MSFDDDDLPLRRLLRKTSTLTGSIFIESAARLLSEELGASIVFVTRLNATQPGLVDILGGTKRGHPLKPWTVDLKGTPCEGIYDSYNPAVDRRGVFTGIVKINKDVSQLFFRARSTQAQAFVGIPLWNEDLMIGHVAMFFDDQLDLDHEDRDIVEIAALFADRIQAELLRLIHDGELKIVMRRLVSVNRKLKAQASHDHLTGLMNRSCLKEQLSKCHTPINTEFYFAMGDIDDFKRVNDCFGHTHGDMVLLEIARRLRRILRGITDQFFRLGGEEFAVLIPANESINLQLVSSLLLKASRFQLLLSDPVDISCSWGLLHSNSSSLEHLYQRADHLLYQAKNSGKNRVVTNHAEPDLLTYQI